MWTNHAPPGTGIPSVGQGNFWGTDERGGYDAFSFAPTYTPDTPASGGGSWLFPSGLLATGTLIVPGSWANSVAGNGFSFSLGHLGRPHTMFRLVLTYGRVSKSFGRTRQLLARRPGWDCSTRGGSRRSRGIRFANSSFDLDSGAKPLAYGSHPKCPSSHVPLRTGGQSNYCERSTERQ